MSYSRAGTAGTTRECPHCKEVILASASVCPACAHHLRFDSTPASGEFSAFSALRVEGDIRPPSAAEAWEYSVVVVIRNGRGDEIARKVVGVGALQGTDVRSFCVNVEVSPVQAKGSSRR